MMEFKEKLKERKAAEEAEKAKLENSESTDENKDSEQQTNNGEVTEETTANGQQTESRSLETDCSEQPDHSQMNGQIESHLQNGDCATKNRSEEEEQQQSNITNSVSTESQSKSSIALESAVVNGKECVVKEESGDSKKKVEAE